jgi:hypothetical protein
MNFLLIIVFLDVVFPANVLAPRFKMENSRYQDVKKQSTSDLDMKNTTNGV